MIFYTPSEQHSTLIQTEVHYSLTTLLSGRTLSASLLLTSPFEASIRLLQGLIINIYCCVPCLVKCGSRKFANAPHGSRPLDLVHWKTDALTPQSH